jgi:hypothetical protein
MKDKTPKSKTVEYQAWSNMRARCLHSSNPGYVNYGARGIKVCDRWAESFDNFLEDMGPRPSSDHSLDRYPDNDGDYEPGNCRWATREEQMNNMRTNRSFEVGDEKLTISQGSKKLGINYSTLKSRLDTGRKGDRLRDEVMGRRMYTHDGLTLSLHGWARRTGCQYFTLRQRLLGGMSFHEAISKTSQLTPRTWNGVTKSLTEWAKDMKINLSTLQDRLRNGWEFGDAIMTPVGKSGRPKRPRVT